MERKKTEQQGLKVSIRGMVQGDIEEIQAIDRKITDQYRALTYAMVSNNILGGELATSVVAEAEGKIVGFLLGQGGGSQGARRAEAKIMGIDPAYLHHGIGTKLMQAFIQNCREHGMVSVHAKVCIHDWWMISFLRSMDFDHDQMIEMVRPLE